MRTVCLIITIISIVCLVQFCVVTASPRGRLVANPENHHARPNRQKRYIILTKLNHRKSPVIANETCPNSAEDFPDFFSITDDQFHQGGIILNFLIGIYCFTGLAIVCDNYFLPCMEKICESLNLSQDVAAATFMSIATSAPELFVNIIGTFITQSDIGIGTVVGSSLFNTLGVASLGGLAASNPLQLHWWPLTRDVIIYISSIILLVVITWDGIIEWHEGLILFVVYFVYLTIMFQNVRILNCVKRLIKRWRTGNEVVDIKSSTKTDHKLNIAVVSSHYGSYMEEPIKRFVDTKEIETTQSDEVSSSLFNIPKGSLWRQCFYFFTFPIRLVLFCTIPNPQKHEKLYPITFVMCIIFIGTNSYVVSWMIAIIGKTFKIPDAVLGLTFLAAGGCLPEAISITIMSRRGEGSMGVSNSLGANTMNILLSLGMPWFLKSITNPTHDSIKVNSDSIKYIIMSLVFVAITLYATLYLNKFRLSRKVGCILISVYCLCIILAIIIEMWHTCNL